MKTKVISPPTSEPISLNLARIHLRITPTSDSPASHPDDTWITDVGIPAARQYCEGFLGRAIAPQVLEGALDAFPTGTGTIEIAGSGVSYIRYIDADGNEQTLDQAVYVVDDYSQPAIISLAPEQKWPDTAAVANAVKIRFLADGYTFVGDSPDSNPLPPVIMAGMLLMLGHLYENREATLTSALTEIPLGIQSLLVPFQLRKSMA